jgi:hypothetical protein
MMRWTRRELFRWVAAAAAASALPACGDNVHSRVFDESELSALRVLANVILPADDEPGAVELGFLDYLERLVTAFDSQPPTIFASGPFSDRNPIPDEDGQPTSDTPRNDFAYLIELDRVSEAAWRLTVAEVRTDLKAGLAEARAASTTPLEQLDFTAQTKLFNGLDPAFRHLLIDLVSEAAFAAPEYGGNRDLMGWQLIHFEGDSQPLGYSQVDLDGNVIERAEAPLSSANPGPDPAPLGGDAQALIETVIAVLGGRVRA